MVKFKGEKGGALVMTLMVSLILSMLGLAILPLTVMEYKTSVNFSDFERAYFLAEAGMEEAIGELDKDWSYGNQANLSIDGNEGSYDIKVEEDGEGKLIKATGKVGNIERTIEAKLEKSGSIFNISELKDYSIFTQGELELNEISNIHGGLVGVHGDLYYKHERYGINTEFLVEGDIIKTTGGGSVDNTIPRVTDRTLLDLSSLNIESYINWLKVNHGGKVTEISGIAGQDKRDIRAHEYPNKADSILIIEGFNEVNLGHAGSEETFNGLIIVNKVKGLRIHNKTTINGMIIFTGKDMDITTFQISGSKIDINGSIIGTNPAIRKGNWQVELHHSPTILSNLDPYLPENFEIVDEGDLAIKLLHWREIDN